MVEPNGGLRVVSQSISPAATTPFRDERLTTRGNPMTLTDPHIAPLVALIAGVLILIVPRLLNYIVAIYLIIVGLEGLNAIHHFIH
jgi:Protein of unknown function (DUF3096)